MEREGFLLKEEELPNFTLETQAVEDLQEVVDFLPLDRMYQIRAEQEMKYAASLEKEKEYTKALAIYREEVECGNVDAMSRIGMMYQKGHGVEQNLKKAAEWYQTGAYFNSTEAMRNLGMLYEKQYKKFGKKEGKTLAETWYKKAADLGDAIAIRFMGDWCEKYEKGIGARQWYVKAAEAGDIMAADKLYKNSIDSYDAEETEYWRKKAQELKMQAKYQKTWNWYKEAATDEGKGKAANELSWICFFQSDFANALYWARKAQKFGTKDWLSKCFPDFWSNFVQTKGGKGTGERDSAKVK